MRISQVNAGKHWSQGLAIFFDLISKILVAYNISLFWLTDEEGQLFNSPYIGNVVVTCKDLEDDEIIELAKFIKCETSTEERKEKLFKYIKKLNNK